MTALNSSPAIEGLPEAHSEQPTAQPAITNAERRRRAEAVGYARASIFLEGFTLSQADEAHAQRFICGEIDLAEFVKVRA